jgi:hypothetical protein
MVSFPDDDESDFRVDSEFFAGRCIYLINIPLIGIYVYQAPLIKGSSIVCVRGVTEKQMRHETYQAPKPV